MRLIDADTLKIYKITINGIIMAVVDRHDIDEAPTIEAEPVRHGHWIDTGSGQECSVCHEIQYGYDNYRYYCPFCGAKMGNEI